MQGCGKIVDVVEVVEFWEDVEVGEDVEVEEVVEIEEDARFCTICRSEKICVLPG